MNTHTLAFLLVMLGITGVWSISEKRWNITVGVLVAGFFGVVVLASMVFGLR